MSCLFCQLIKKEIPASIVYEDEKVLAFNDIAPQAPVHILVIPKAHIPALAEVGDPAVMADLFRVAIKLAHDLKLTDQGFRTVINNGRAAGQAVDHLHLHLLGGRDFSWPPG
jgi:histidine triad (HIT) family protein